MAAGYPIKLGTTVIRTSEHLYQAMRFTGYPDLQQELIAIPSPMGAKMFSRSHNEKTRPDWDAIKVEVMEWVLDLKLLNNIEKFGTLLLSTGDKPLVERSKKDTFWGAEPIDDLLRGLNMLGKLLWLLRKRHKEGLEIRTNPLLTIPDFLFFGEDAVSLAKTGLLV